MPLASDDLLATRKLIARLEDQIRETIIGERMTTMPPVERAGCTLADLHAAVQRVRTLPVTIYAMVTRPDCTAIFRDHTDQLFAGLSGIARSLKPEIYEDADHVAPVIGFGDRQTLELYLARKERPTEWLNYLLRVIPITREGDTDE